MEHILERCHFPEGLKVNEAKVLRFGSVLDGEVETTAYRTLGFNSILHIVYKMYKKLTRKYNKSDIVNGKGEE